MASKLFGREPEAAPLTLACDSVSLRTEQRLQFVDVTELVAERVRRSGVREGQVLVQTLHTTTAVVVNENEPLLLGDVRRLLERLAPGGARYAHDDLDRRRHAAPDEPLNGDAHCRALLLGASQSLVVADERLRLGRWQRIFLVELDGPRARTLLIQVMGARR